jgi:diguanylate cyclase (GGDEF)-like protein/PAS domain S-box-containing protein
MSDSGRHTALRQISELTARGFSSSDEAIGAILRLMQDVLDLSTALVTQSDQDTWRATYVAEDTARGFGIQPGAELPLADTFCGLITARDQPVIINNALADPELQDISAPIQLDVQTFIGVLLQLHDGTTYGTLCAFDREPGRVDDGDIFILQVLARLVAHELEHEQHVARVQDEHQQRFQAVVETAADAIVTIDDGGTILDWNTAAETMLGYRRSEAVGMAAALLLPASQRRAYEIELAVLRRRGLSRLSSGTIGINLVHRNGREIPVEFSLGQWEAQGERRYTGLIRDVSARKQAKAALEQSEARFRSLIQNASEIVTILDRTGTITYESPALTRIAGWEPDELVGATALNYVHPQDRADVASALASLLTQPLGEHVPPVEFRFRHKDGSWRWFEALGTNLLEEPAVGGLVVNSRDVTERRAFTERLTRQVNRDPLTGLPNRRRFLDHLREAAMLDDRPNEITVLFLDLDDFKVVNDSLGHSAGDLLLIAVGQRLKRFQREGDMLARLGGDEFTFLLKAISTAEEAMETASRIVTAFREPFVVIGRELWLTPSIGIAVGVPAQNEPDELLRQADLAMYSAKWQGKSGAVIFEPGMDVVAHDRLEMGEGLRRAVPREELRLHYQPIVDIASGEITAFEALVRWNSPRHGMLGPDAFIPVAEENGMVVPIGRWVLGEACRVARAWQKEHPREKRLGIAVNFAALHFRGPTLLNDIRRVLGVTGLPANSLTVELSEHVALDDTPGTAVILRELVELGVHLAIDDFGTGFSGLSAIKAAPVHTLKIDRSFVGDLATDQDDVAIVRAIITLSRSLGMVTTAEGVETTEQLAVLRALGCDQAQGFLFSPPVTAEEVGQLLAGSTLPGSVPSEIPATNDSRVQER